MDGPVATKTPWHLWVIGLVSLVWHAGGAIDYTMTQTRNMEYLNAAAAQADVPVEVMLGYFGNWPAWAEAAWAFGVWGAVAGSLLLLLRTRYALYAFVVSLIGLLGTTVYTLTADLPDALDTPMMWAFSAAVYIVLIALVIYTRRMTARGVLR